MKLFIYVEGQEEEMFVNRVLRNHLRSFGVIVQKPILAATSFRLGSEDAEVTVGGVTNYEAIRADIINQFEAGDITTADVLTTLIDLYALPANFPGLQEANMRCLTGGAKAAYIESAWKTDVCHANFFPYFQVHEFEALILTRPSVLNDYYPEHAENIERLGRECSSFRSPEDINEVKETSPSHRILNHIPNYQKLDGFRHIQDIGLPEVRVHCQRFAEWIRQCEHFFR